MRKYVGFLFIFFGACKPFDPNHAESSRILAMYRQQMKEVDELSNVNDSELCEFLTSSDDKTDLGLSVSFPSRMGMSGGAGLALGVSSDDFVFLNTGGVYHTLAIFKSNARSIPFDPKSLASAGVNFGVTFSFFLTNAKNVYSAWNGPFRQLTSSFPILVDQFGNFLKGKKNHGLRHLLNILSIIMKLLRVDGTIGLYGGGGWHQILPTDIPWLKFLKVPNMDTSGIIGIAFSLMATVSYDMSDKIPKILKFDLLSNDKLKSVVSRLSSMSYDLSEATYDRERTVQLHEKLKIGEMVTLDKSDPQSPRLIQIQPGTNVERVKTGRPYLSDFLNFGLPTSMFKSLEGTIFGALMMDALIKDHWRSPKKGKLVCPSQQAKKPK